ncbi:MAG TPA: penicillin-binding transpeptidase domain-containing protein [Acetobacteraceae bacterium]|nr:penicillin-binding transpeptidase domain-containing protein [Acetobacteraceae bacterium]
MTTPPSPDATPARLRGVPDGGAMPRMETVRITAPDLQRRAALERTRQRLVFTAGGFSLLFGAVAAKLTWATVLFPMPPPAIVSRPEVPPDPGPMRPDASPALATVKKPRATIIDRNGEILAISLPTAALFADPKEMIDPADAAHKLKQVLPRLNEAEARARLEAAKSFVYLERQITPAEELAINSLGIPGVYFQPGEKRRYPLGRVAAQVLGGVDIDSHGVAGVEKAFDARLEDSSEPLQLSIDVRVQSVMRDELDKSMTEFQAIGACGIVMDVRTGEVLAMVSLPDYDANDFGDTPPDDRFNRAVTGMFEPGSTFKLQTAAMALDFGSAHIWDEFDAAHNIHIGRFTITDFKGKHRMLYLPEVLAYSSNLGAAHIALGVGAERQRLWLRAMGMFSRIGIQLPEAGLPIIPPARNWGESTVMTVGFGHGIAVSPLHVVRGTAAVANGGIVLQPTILEHDPADGPVQGRRIMNVNTSDTIRKLMRLVVTAGYGKPADVPGYFVGGKTGTAEKVGAHGYKKHSNVSAFISVFPMDAPRYAVYFMLDEPKGNKETGGYSTAGVVSAPGAGRVIARIAPMLGLFPRIKDEAEIQASLDIPLEPARGSGEPTGNNPVLQLPAPPPAAAAATVSLPPTPPRRDLLALRHEAAYHVRRRLHATD